MDGSIYLVCPKEQKAGLVPWIFAYLEIFGPLLKEITYHRIVISYKEIWPLSSVI